MPTMSVAGQNPSDSICPEIKIVLVAAFVVQALAARLLKPGISFLVGTVSAKHGAVFPPGLAGNGMWQWHDFVKVFKYDLAKNKKKSKVARIKSRLKLAGGEVWPHVRKSWGFEYPQAIEVARKTNRSSYWRALVRIGLFSGRVCWIWACLRRHLWIIDGRLKPNKCGRQETFFLLCQCWWCRGLPTRKECRIT